MHQPSDNRQSSSNDGSEPAGGQPSNSGEQSNKASSASEEERIRKAKLQFAMQHMDTTGCLFPVLIICIISFFSTLATGSLTSSISSTFSGIVRDLNKLNNDMNKQNR